LAGCRHFEKLRRNRLPLGLKQSFEIAAVDHIEVERFEMSLVFAKHVLVEKEGLRLGCFIDDDWIVETMLLKFRLLE